MAYLLAYLGIAGLIAVGLLISVAVRAQSTAVLLASAVFFLMEGIRNVFKEPASSCMITRYARDPLERLSSLARAMAVYEPPEHLWKSAAVPLGYLLLLGGVSLLLFQRRDVLD